MLDDPASALDVDTEQVLWERVLSEPNATCLLVSNRPGVLSRADNVLHMKDGRIVDQGKYDELVKRTQMVRLREPE